MIHSKNIIILDGGLSNQLESQGLNLNNPLWSASLLKENPSAIVTAHLKYLEAGANCIITSSYQASEQGFIKAGLEASEARILIKKSVTLAEIAIKQHLTSQPSDSERPLIAASIGPYGATMADGSEYHGNYDITDEELRLFHSNRLILLDETNADVLACETIPSLQEARVLEKLLRKTKTPAWISFSCKDEHHINDGHLIEEVVALFINHPNVLAIGINCTAPNYVNGLVRRVKNAVPDKAILVYPNSGETYNAKNKTWSGLNDHSQWAQSVIPWIESGATIIGGCCRIGPSHIKEINKLTNVL